MNPFLDQSEIDKRKLLKSKIDGLSDKIADLKSDRNVLLLELYEAKKLCTHEDSEGKSTWKYTGQDPGSGRSEYECTICNKSS